jgi:formylglycine-generating enzyme required for sulfatase activity
MFLGFAAGNSRADDPAADLDRLLTTFVGEFVEITPGEGKFPKSFQMGSGAGAKSEQPVHEVTVERPFAIAKYEVPQNLYQAVMGENPSRWKGPRNSAEMMTFSEALQFCDKLTELLRERALIGEDEIIRLPTEAEWEYCCRAGTQTAYSFGDAAQKPGDAGKKASVLDAFAWHTGNAAGNDPPVGALKPNPWGLYDMHGYLWEFTADAWQPNYEDAPKDGSAAPIAGERDQIVVRGGSWKNEYPALRSSARQPFGQAEKDDAVGFRCVKTSKGK